MKISSFTILYAFASLLSLAFGQQPCMKGWRLQLRRFRNAKKRWMMYNTTCYDFTEEQSSFTVPKGPIDVSVRGGVVVSPLENGKPAAPSMQKIFRLISQECFANCPDEGPATCTVKYADEGYVKFVFINPTPVITDKQIGYNITNFKFCGDDN